MVFMLQIPIIQADGSWRFVVSDSVTPAELCGMVAKNASRSSGGNASENSVASEGAVLEARLAMSPVAVPFAEWPLTARIVRSLRSADDQGVGDTIHRQLGAPGRWFETAANSLGINCGCADRRDWLNQRYPYSPQ